MGLPILVGLVEHGTGSAFAPCSTMLYLRVDRSQLFESKECSDAAKVLQDETCGKYAKDGSGDPKDGANH